jgi:hypothetical protein
MTSAISTRRTRTPRRMWIWVLRIVVATGLVVDAVVHLRLASEYQLAFPEGMGGGTLFRVQAAVAIVAAVGVLLRADRRTFLFAFLVAASAFVAVVVTRYVEIPALGPLPSMYEPLWFFEKSLSAVAEAAAAVAAGVALVIRQRATSDHG